MSTEWRSVDTDRCLVCAITISVAEIEPLWYCEVKLIGSEGKLPPDHGPDLYVDLGAVERCFVFCFDERDVEFEECISDLVFSLDPECLVVDVFFAESFLGVLGESHLVFFDAELFEVFEVHLDYFAEFFFELFFGTVDMGIVHAE